MAEKKSFAARGVVFGALFCICSLFMNPLSCMFHKKKLTSKMVSKFLDTLKNAKVLGFGYDYFKICFATETFSCSLLSDLTQYLVAKKMVNPAQYNEGRFCLKEKEMYQVIKKINELGSLEAAEEYYFYAKALAKIINPDQTNRYKDTFGNCLAQKSFDDVYVTKYYWESFDQYWEQVQKTQLPSGDTLKDKIEYMWFKNKHKVVACNTNEETIGMHESEQEGDIGLEEKKEEKQGLRKTENVLISISGDLSTRNEASKQIIEDFKRRRERAFAIHNTK